MIKRKKIIIDGLPVIRFEKQDDERFVGGIYPDSIQSANFLKEEIMLVLSEEKKESRIDMDYASISITKEQCEIFDPYAGDKKALAHYETTQILDVAEDYIRVIAEHKSLKDSI